MPYEHVREIIRVPITPTREKIIQRQWDFIRNQVGPLKKVAVVCDVSDSMEELPKCAGLALGILASEVAAPSFRDHILLFASEPRWVSLSGTLVNKISCFGKLPTGTTNFQSVGELIIERLLKNRVSREDAPEDILLFTDMGFDKAQDTPFNGKIGWETHFEMLRRNFAQHGYKPPRIICWNLRTQFKDYHSKADYEGVVQLSGWSPLLLNDIDKALTPYEGLRAILDNPRYDKLRSKEYLVS